MKLPFRPSVVVYSLSDAFTCLLAGGLLVTSADEMLRSKYNGDRKVASETPILWRLNVITFSRYSKKMFTLFSAEKKKERMSILKTRANEYIED